MPPLTLVVMGGERSAAGFVRRDCRVHDNFQRTLINGSPGGLIGNSTLQSLGCGLVVQFETRGPWMEGPFARDLVVRNSRFIDAPPGGARLSVSMHPPGGSQGAAAGGLSAGRGVPSRPNSTGSSAGRSRNGASPSLPKNVLHQAPSGARKNMLWPPWGIASRRGP